MQKVQHLLCTLAHSCLFASSPRQTKRVAQRTGAGMARQAGHYVVEYAHMLEQGIVLEGAPDPESRRLQGADPFKPRAVEDDTPGIRAIDAIHDVKCRTLSGSIRADQGANLPSLNRERKIRQRLHTLERERNIMQGEERLGHRELAIPRQAIATLRFRPLADESPRDREIAHPDDHWIDRLRRRTISPAAYQACSRSGKRRAAVVQARAG